MLSKDEEREGKAALAAAARAFKRAQKLGYVWLSEQGTFETIESQIGFTPTPHANPDQLQFH